RSAHPHQEPGLPGGLRALPSCPRCTRPRPRCSYQPRTSRTACPPKPWQVATFPGRTWPTPPSRCTGPSCETTKASLRFLQLAAASLLADPVIGLDQKLHLLDALRPHVGRELDDELVAAVHRAPKQLASRNVGDERHVPTIRDRVQPFLGGQ